MNFSQSKPQQQQRPLTAVLPDPPQPSQHHHNTAQRVEHTGGTHTAGYTHTFVPTSPHEPTHTHFMEGASTDSMSSTAASSSIKMRVVTLLQSTAICSTLNRHSVSPPPHRQEPDRQYPSELEAEALTRRDAALTPMKRQVSSPLGVCENGKTARS